MVNRPARYDIQRPVEFRLTDVRDSPQLHGRTVNISSSGVLIQTSQKIPVGRKLEMIVRMAVVDENVEVNLRLLGIAVRSGDGWVAVHVKKHQILPGKMQIRHTPQASE